MKSALKQVLATLAIALASAAAIATTVTIVAAKATTGATSAVPGNVGPTATKTYHVLCRTSSGTGTAVVSIEGSNDGSNFDATPLATATIPLTTASSPWPNKLLTLTDRPSKVRANVTSLSGTGANCTVTMSY